MTTRGARLLLAIGIGAVSCNSAAECSIAVSFGSFEPNTQSIPVTATNRCPTKIALKEAYLPWGNRYSMTLVAFRPGKHNSVVDGVFPVDDPDFRVVSLSPGQAIKGAINLGDYVKNLEQELSTGPLVIMWSYQPRLADESPVQRVGGWFELQRLDPAK